ncbi:MAG: putative peptidoglycan glycosyltransferase FtsW [Candidatus Marinimicrobia bacterium]|nr:putative peptidoglycan glycosyltransferase FtsW [Candidatus Neomarinimicrobiota bacterium]MDP6592609.1 putative peptidoglycan glycosyltransferase FtsW [Candidatus Neomarinimicrobiota bacterium]MDP6836660.1 putative peptidoglycan glycosyltransferase FtsW [Candidatus Neomarinimicrobiota bacterium]
MKAIQVSSQHYDKSLLTIALILVSIGTVMVFSASTNISMENYGNGTHFFRRHLLRAAIGLIFMITAMRVDYRILKKIASPFLIGSIVLLILTKVLYLVQGNSSPARWMSLGLLSLQTSDIARFAIILYLAAYVDKKRDQLRDFVTGFLPPIVVIGIIMGLIIIQPDFSTAVMIGMISVTLLFVSGARLPHIIATASVSIAILIPVLLAAEYRIARIKSFFSGGLDISGMNYQVQQSLISLGNGGITGVGLGESVGKNLFLPLPHTDFILSIIGEEVGFAGIFLIITLYLALFQRALKISKGCTDIFGILLATGLALQVILYAFINSAVVTAMVPTTGLPMPFISFGGSGLVTNLLSIGILLNISMAKRIVREKKPAGVLFA